MLTFIFPLKDSAAIPYKPALKKILARQAIKSNTKAIAISAKRERSDAIFLIKNSKLYKSFKLDIPMKLNIIPMPTKAIVPVIKRDINSAMIKLIVFFL
jgi:hypothetical protein